MGKVMVVAAVSVDGFIADPSDGIGPLFDWYENGSVAIAPGDPERIFHVTEPTAKYMRESWTKVGACVIGRRLFDITDGWGGRPAAGDRDVTVTADDIGRQVLDEGLADEVVLSMAPAVFGTGIRFFGEIAKPPLLLENPTVIEGDRVTHLIYPVRKG
jgi:dihydrofolate reductase